jgi:hypothetical protein
MNMESTARRLSRGPLRRCSIGMAASAVAVMGIVTFAANSPGGYGVTGPAFIAGTTSTAPPSAPSVPSAAPPVKATSYAGGDWPGMGG